MNVADISISGRARLWSRVAVVAFTGVIAVASLLSKSTLEEIPFQFNGMDLVAHVLMYALYAILLFRAWPAARLVPTLAVSIVVYCAAYGLLMEVLQHTMSWLNRTFSPFDALGNTAGAVAAAIFMTRGRSAAIPRSSEGAGNAA